MSGNIDLYAGGRTRTAMQTFDGARINELIYSHKPTFDDGKLEFATFDSLFYWVLNRSNSLAQEGGPFQLDFYDDRKTRTFINIDGEFYKAYNLRKITIKKGESLCENGHLRILINKRKEIFD